MFFMSHACHITNKNWVRATKNAARLSPKNIECLYVRQEHVTAQNTKTLFHLLPKNPICRLEKRNCVRATKKCLTGDIKLSPKNTECMCDKSISQHNRQKQYFCATRLVPRATNLSPKNTETQYGRHQFIVSATTMSPKNSVCISAIRTCRTGDKLVTQKRRNWVSEMGAHKHCKFINISTEANFGGKNKNYS